MTEFKVSSKKEVISTKFWGELEIEMDEVIFFKRGIPGFKNNKQFALLDSEDIKPFYWLVNVEDPGLAFVLIDPQNFLQDYQPKLYESDLMELKADPNDVIVMLAIITLTTDPVKSTVNLLGPLLINTTKKLGKQIVVVDDQYSTKYLILDTKNQNVLQNKELVAV